MDDDLDKITTLLQFVYKLDTVQVCYEHISLIIYEILKHPIFIF